MTDRFHFDSAAFPPGEAFDAYRRLYALGSDVSRGPGPFLARVSGVRLDGLLLFDRRLDGVVHARDGAMRDGFDHFALHLVLDGELAGGRDSRFERAGPGDLVLADTRRASRTEARGLHVLTASVPRAAVAAACGKPDALHGRIVGPPRTFVLRDLMQSVLRHAGDFGDDALPSLRRAFQELLNATLAELSTASAVLLRVDQARRAAAESYIVAHLGDRHLDAAAVAAGIGASRSSLYRLFADEGGVAHFIMSRRLAAVRDALDRGASEPLSALALAHGFTDESHLNRRFKQAYGQSAGAFRRAAAELGEDGVAAAARRWAGWMVEVG